MLLSSTGFHTAYLGFLPSESRQCHACPAQFRSSAVPAKGRPQGHCHTGQAMAGKEVAALWLLALLGCGSGGKVLVWPADNSHWLNMEHILQELVARGHEVTVLLPSCFLILNPTQPSPFQFEVIEVPITKKEMADLMDKILYFFFYELEELPVWKSVYKVAQMMYQMNNMTKIICDGVVKNEALMERLRASAFDVLLADPLAPSGERLCGTLPSPPSYVPSTSTSLTDRMTFWERLKNIFSYTLQDFAFHYVFWETGINTTVK